MALREGSRVFLRFDSPSRGRLLAAGVLREIRDDVYTISFLTRHQAVETGEQKLIYYNRARNFVRQPVRVEAQSSAGPPFELTVRALGDAESAGTREEDRVPTFDTGLMATLDDEDNCAVYDVSLSGLAVVSARKYHIGRCLEVAIRYADDEYVGEAEVQCAHPIDSVQTRYGLLGVFDSPEGRDLKNGLTRMTLELQQQRLKRLSRSS